MQEVKVFSRWNSQPPGLGKAAEADPLEWRVFVAGLQERSQQWSCQRESDGNDLSKGCSCCCVDGSSGSRPGRAAGAHLDALGFTVLSGDKMGRRNLRRPAADPTCRHGTDNIEGSKGGTLHAEPCRAGKAILVVQQGVLGVFQQPPEQRPREYPPWAVFQGPRVASAHPLAPAGALPCHTLGKRPETSLWMPMGANSFHGGWHSD
jgi:hypothetical protein